VVAACCQVHVELPDRRWAGEWNAKPGVASCLVRAVIESRRGSTGHQANPWFALQAGEASEDHGEVMVLVRWPGAGRGGSR